MNKLKNMLISNVNKHHKIIDSYFCSVWYGEDIIMELYIYFNSILCNIMNIFIW